MIHRQRQVGIQGFADRFAIIPGFRQSQQLQILLNAIGDRQQHVRTFLRTGFAPRIGGGMGGVERLFDVRST